MHRQRTIVPIIIIIIIMYNSVTVEYKRRTLAIDSIHGTQNSNNYNNNNNNNNSNDNKLHTQHTLDVLHNDQRYHRLKLSTIQSLRLTKQTYTCSKTHGADQMVKVKHKTRVRVRRCVFVA
jgi:hypothetical protein